MFESAEIGHAIDKQRYEQEVPPLREALLNAQFDLVQAASFPVIILVGGLDGAGKSETINLLNEWMDPRHIQVTAGGDPSTEEKGHPYMWRFWRNLPPRGKIGVFFGSWYAKPIMDRTIGKIKTADLRQSIDEINRFELMLCNEKALVLKFWFHLSKKEHKKRLKTLEKNPLTRWRVTPADWQRYKMHTEFCKWSEYTLRQTSSGICPWFIVEGVDVRYRNLTVGNILLEALQKRLVQQQAPTTPAKVSPLLPKIDKLNIIKSLKLNLKLEKSLYDTELEKYQGRLNLLTRKSKFHKKFSLIIAFEGNDAAGKGGSIRRVTSALDARTYRVTQIAAPTDEEKAQPYLWRFWRHLPAKGKIQIFDRTWYGRVLVERVEGFCSELDWMRAYREINDFEEQLVSHKILLAKFWLAISKKEQLKRFEEREKIGFKQFKITEEDWRNREKWDDYERAVCDMVERTSTARIPWTLVEANDKKYARVKILKTLCTLVEEAL